MLFTPFCGPIVHFTAATPFGSVFALAGDTEPPPAVTANATLALPTLRPAGFVTRTRTESPTVAPGVAAFGGVHCTRLSLAGPSHTTLTSIGCDCLPSDDATIWVVPESPATSFPPGRKLAAFSSVLDQASGTSSFWRWMSRTLAASTTLRPRSMVTEPVSMVIVPTSWGGTIEPSPL